LFVAACFLNATDDNKLIESAQDYGSTVPKEFLMFWFKELNIDSVLAALSLRCRYANVAEYELKIDGSNYIIFRLYIAAGNKNCTSSTSSVRNIQKFSCIKISFALAALLALYN
jgi:hypothetical protein